jgi:putative transposase
MNRRRYTISTICQFFGVSRSGCYDNAMAENFFSILKTECFYKYQATIFEEADVLIDNYIYFCNHQHIRSKNEVAQRQRCHSA